MEDFDSVWRAESTARKAMNERLDAILDKHVPGIPGQPHKPKRGKRRP